MVRLPSLMICVLVWSACLIIVDASSCGGTLMSNYGEITYPYNSSSLGSNLSCVWRIEGATGSRVVIGFKAFSLRTGCGDEYIQIGHGNITTSRYCGAHIPDRVITQSPNATIVFVTDHYTHLSGFQLYWKVFKEPELIASPDTFEAARVKCERNGGKLMEPDLDYIDTYRESIIEQMRAKNVLEIWVRKYFTPWVFLKGCTHKNYVQPQKIYTVKNNQQKICQNLCSGYNYFGLKESNCVCLNDVVSCLCVPSAYASCQFKCQGNTEELCGGEYSYTVYKNNFCYTSSESWNGTLTKDIYGNPCLPWNQTTLKNSTFPDGSANDAENNCRDPNGSGTPWCYRNQTHNGTCAVSACLDMTAKQNGSYECFAVLTYNQGLPGPYSFTGLQMPCSTSLSGIYARTRKGPWTAPSECFKLQRRETTLEEKTDTCDLKLSFICQKGPVNCGQSFVKTESKLNFTIESGSYDMNCEWKIEGYDSTLVRIDILFDIEQCPDCECDSLKIYDASSAIGPPNKTLCGKEQVAFNSTQKSMTLTYSSDRSVEGKGIKAQWSFVPLHSQSTTSTPSESTTKSGTGSEDMSPSTFSVSLPSQSTTSTPVETRSEDVPPNTLSAGLIGGIVAAAVVITASVIVCVVVTRRRRHSSLGSSMTNIVEQVALEDITPETVDSPYA